MNESQQKWTILYIVGEPSNDTIQEIEVTVVEDNTCESLLANRGLATQFVPIGITSSLFCAVSKNGVQVRIVVKFDYQYQYVKYPCPSIHVTIFNPNYSLLGYGGPFWWVTKNANIYIYIL